MALIQKAFSDIITFSRSSNATRVGPTGLVEYAPHNLLTYSEQFDNAAWGKLTGGTGVAPVVTANATASPDGTVTADKVVFDRGAGTSGSDISYLAFSLASFTATATASIWIKTTDGSTQTMSFRCGAAAPSRITVTGNWTRFTITQSNATIDRVQVLLYGNDGSQTVSVYLWGAQLAVGPLPLDYTPTTSAAVYGPRFDYDPVTLAARGLLVEEQRTNLLTYSEQFNNAAWFADNVIKTADTTTSPDGTVNADSITESATTANHRIYQSLSKAASAITYTASVYAKTNGRNMRLHFDGGTVANRVSASFDLSTGTISVAASVIGTFSGASATITPVGNDWYRCTVTATTGTETIVRPNIFVLNGTSDNYAGNGTSGIYLWGAQLEAGSFATSYIPTVASTVTRSADVASVNTLSPWFNNTEFSYYVEFTPGVISNNTLAATFSDGSDSNRAFTSSGTGEHLSVSAGGVTQANLDGGTAVLGSVNRIAAALAANDFAVSVNGGTPATDNSGTVPTLTTLHLATYRGSSSFLNGHLRRFSFYPRKLSSAELQALTA